MPFFQVSLPRLLSLALPLPLSLLLLLQGLKDPRAPCARRRAIHEGCLFGENCDSGLVATHHRLNPKPLRSGTLVSATRVAQAIKGFRILAWCECGRRKGIRRCHAPWGGPWGPCARESERARERERERERERAREREREPRGGQSQPSKNTKATKTMMGLHLHMFTRKTIFPLNIYFLQILLLYILIGASRTVMAPQLLS